jgi:signal transduction histidine kinase
VTAYAWADRNVVNLVLRNLLTNAIKFTPKNGQIVTGIIAFPSHVKVFVEDSGQGITKEEMVKINSDSFYSTSGTNSERGTGLGLMLCKEFLAKSHGQMTIESEPGFGSTFSFTLPVAE